MPQPYRKFRLLTRVFCLLAILWVGGAQASSLAPVIPEFTPYDAPRALGDVAFQDSTGKTRKLSEFRGRLVLVNLWATWCAPCRQELPALDDLQRAFQKTKLTVLAISLDGANKADKIKKFYQEAGIKTLGIYQDSAMALMAQWRPKGLPTSYLIAPDGRAVGEVAGFAHWNTPEAANLIEGYLN